MIYWKPLFWTKTDDPREWSQKTTDPVLLASWKGSDGYVTEDGKLPAPVPHIPYYSGGVGACVRVRIHVWVILFALLPNVATHA